MRFSRMKSHPDFAVEGRSQHFQGCFEMELTPGEETLTLQNAKHEELIYLLSGQALITMERKESELGSGDLILIPAQKWRKITNTSSSTTRLISFASSLQNNQDESEQEPNSLQTLDSVLQELPTQIKEIDAIQTIIKLFDIGGQLTQQIERCVGLNNDTGLEALIALQKRLMKAVVNITNKYQASKQPPK